MLDAPVRILNGGLVKSCLVSLELLLFQVDFKVLCKEVIAAGLVADAVGLFVAVEESKDVLSFFFAVFPLSRLVVDAVLGDVINRGEMGKGSPQELPSFIIWIEVVEDFLDGVNCSFSVSADILEVCKLNVVIG
jgi:hypothetical protein